MPGSTCRKSSLTRECVLLRQGHKEGSKYGFMADLSDALEHVYNAAGFALNRRCIENTFYIENMSIMPRALPSIAGV